MYITYSPAEKRRVLCFHSAEHDNGQRGHALAREDRPIPARDVAPGECWAFTGSPEDGRNHGRGPLVMAAERFIYALSD